MKAFIGIFAGLLVISGYMHFMGSGGSNYSVGVAQAQVTAKIDLTDKLNPQILPDVLRQVMASMEVKEKPEKEKFQKELVQKFSHAIMNDPDVNYRVDLNEDGTIDPIMVVPSDVGGEGAIYSLRVPDPSDHPKDPGATSDWDKISKSQSIELVEVGVTFDPNAKNVAISSTPNGHVYENTGANTHYTQSYPASGHNWINTYFQYRLFSAILFGPYGWGFGPFYGGYYGSYYRPYPTSYRSAPNRSSRYKNSPRSNTALKTSGGKSLGRSSINKKAPASIQKIKSQRAMAVRKQKYATSKRTGGFGNKSVRSGGFGRQRSSAFGGGGSRGFGK